MTLILPPVLPKRQTSWELSGDIIRLRDVTAPDQGGVTRGFADWKNYPCAFVQGFSLARLRFFMAADDSEATIGIYTWPMKGPGLLRYTGNVTSGAGLPDDEDPINGEALESTTFYEADTIATPDATLGDSAIAILPETQADGFNAFMHIALQGHPYLHVALPDIDHRTIVGLELFA